VRILLAGASGLIGVRLVPLLVAQGHEVAGITRSPAKAAGLAALGAQPVVCDVYDVDRLRSAAVAFGPELVMHQLTDLPDDRAELERPETAGANARVRREGTANLIAAATAAGCQRLIAQSVAWELPGDGGAAKAELERSALDFGGVVLRYGQFYGPGTYHPDRPPRPPSIHIDDAARRTAELLEAEPGILTIVDG